MSCLLIGTVTDLALVMEEHRAAHRIAGLALVQPGMAMLAQVRAKCLSFTKKPRTRPKLMEAEEILERS